jgi:hypothetical protein
MNGYIITTAYNNVIKTDERGYVLEYSNGLKKDRNDENRKTWQITGAWYNVGFGHIHRINLTRLSTVDADYLYLTNGKPRYGLTDVDHGTQRLQGNKEYHGVIHICTY